MINWSEQDTVWQPSDYLVANSNLAKFMRELNIASHEELLERADKDHEWWWNLIAGKIDFVQPYETLLETDAGIPFARWCVGGTTNIVNNALDRHRGTANWSSPAVIGESERGDARIWTYAELAGQTSRLAAGLKALGIGRGDVVAVYMPNINEAISSLLAITKIGAVAMPLFSGFGVEAIATRLRASGAAAVLTVAGTTRRGRWVPMRDTIHDASLQCPAVKHVISLRNGDGPLTDIDVDFENLCKGRPNDLPNEQLSADSPALLIYTSGTTGQPKGTVHSHAGFAAKLWLDLHLMMDMKPSDCVVWQSDMGWLVGPILAFGATMIGASFVLADGAPDYPNPTRMWSLIEKYRATFLGIAPTLIRSFMHGAGIGKSDLSSLRVCVSTGEAWTPDAWWWTFENVLSCKAPIINYAGGTEIGGGILSGSFIRPMKPCAFSGPIPGMGADIVDVQGNSVGPGVVGELVLRKPSIGLSRGLWNDRDRYLDSYWRDIPGVWRQGDWAVRDSEGFWYILGRSDDTLKIAGKRTGPAEIEAILTDTKKVREAAAIGVPDVVKGEQVGCVVVLQDGIPADDRTRSELSDAIVSGLGNPYRPGFVLFVSDLPKTRNMKIMRRLVRAACLGKSLGDTSSLLNPESVSLVRAAAENLNEMQNK